MPSLAGGEALISIGSGFGVHVTGTITLKETNYLAPMAVVNGSDTFFAYAAANSDGFAHFRSLGDNIIGLEDLWGGGDRDFDDMIIQIAPTTLA